MIFRVKFRAVFDFLEILKERRMSKYRWLIRIVESFEIFPTEIKVVKDIFKLQRSDDTTTARYSTTNIRRAQNTFLVFRNEIYIINRWNGFLLFEGRRGRCSRCQRIFRSRHFKISRNVQRYPGCVEIVRGSIKDPRYPRGLRLLLFPLKQRT